METYLKLKKIVLDMEKDIEKVFIKHQDQAAKRARVQLQEVRALGKLLRQEIQDTQKHYKYNKNNDFQL